MMPSADAFELPPPQSHEDLELFLGEMATLLNKYHYTISDTFDVCQFSDYRSLVARITRYENVFTTVNKIYKEKR